MSDDAAVSLTEVRDRIMGPWAAAAEADGWDDITPDSLYWAAVDGIAWSLLDQTCDLADSGPSVESLAAARATAERALSAQPSQDDPQPDEREALVVVEPDSWPCDLRVTHGPHVAEWVQRAHEGSAFATTERGLYDCPGARREWPASVVDLAWTMSVARYGHTHEHVARLLAINPAWVPYNAGDLVAADAVLAAGFRRDPDVGLRAAVSALLTDCRDALSRETALGEQVVSVRLLEQRLAALAEPTPGSES